MTDFGKRFLSTLSLRRATFPHDCYLSADQHFYPRSPCGERREQAITAEQTARISIHALLAESDCIPRSDGLWQEISIHALLAESDNTSPGAKSRTPISIHALLAESDSMSCWNSHQVTVFLSTLSLRRATGSVQVSGVPSNVFLSTLSLRRATPMGALTIFRG